MKTRGQSIRLFLVDGNADGLVTAEIVNWTGHILCAPRGKIVELLRRKEMTRTGIYFLTGAADSADGGAKLYIGETENVGKRLRQHNDDKEFWDKVWIVTSKDMNLTKAHVKYLESQLLSLAKNARRSNIDNETFPNYDEQLPESDVNDMEYFIEQIKIILPVLSFDFLQQPHADIYNSENPIFEITLQGSSVIATATEVEGKFIVLKGSLASHWRGAGHSYKGLVDRLIADGVLQVDVDKKEQMSFVKDCEFNSPSAASTVIRGRASNGREDWRLKGTRETYAKWQNRQITALATAESG